MNRSLFADRHPYGFVALLEIVVIVVYLVAGTAAQLLGLSNLGLYGLANLGLTLVAAFLLTTMGWWRAAGFRAPARKGDLLYFVVPFLPMFVNFIPGLEITGLRQVTGILAITLMVGFVEEAFFRGLMLNALKPRGFGRAAIVTSLLFGLTHAMNVLAGKSLLEDAAQIVYALAIGFAFAALVLKKGLLWPLVIAHFAIDFVNFLQNPNYAFPPGWDAAIVLGISVVFVAYGLFVMLQKKERPAPAARRL